MLNTHTKKITFSRVVVVVMNKMYIPFFNVVYSIKLYSIIKLQYYCTVLNINICYLFEYASMYVLIVD